MTAVPQSFGRARRPVTQLALLAVAAMLAMTLWFSATAVLPALQAAWDLSPTGSAWMTAAVQLGFVAGALGSAFFNLPDVIPPRRMFWASAALGAAVNAVLATPLVSSGGPAVALRFLTGVFLAGVYPPGMKIAAGHVTGCARGLAIGVLVGALTLGSATPHVVAALGAGLPYRVVLGVSSGLAVAGALVVAALVMDGPYAPEPAPFDPRQVGQVLRDRDVLLANCGYFGHMWELYAMWTWLVVFMGGALASTATARWAAFAIIGVAGAVGAIVGGRLADRYGRTAITIAAMAVSGACCLMSPLLYTAPAVWLLVFGVVWGTTIVADSAQFSAAVTELARPEYMGTALTLQTSIGFAITLIPIWGTPYLADAVGWRYAFVALAPGPALGCVAMARLRARPNAIKMAAGKR